jgi:D-aminoacyl-tRNA deacylase
MRVLLQRVTAGSVSVDGQTVGHIGHGLVLLVGAGQRDTQDQADRLIEKVAHLRVFNDEAGKFNRSLLDVGGGALVVSQFTLYADARKGRRPSFTDAARPEVAAPLIDYFAQGLRRLGVAPVETGRFGAMMHVTIENDGPVTIWLDSDELSDAGAGVRAAEL